MENIAVTINTLNNLPPTAQITLGIIMVLIPIGYVIYLKVSTDPKFIKSILELKYKKKSLVGLVRMNLDRISVELAKLIRDLDALELYNSEHAKKLIEQLRYAEISVQFIHILENSRITGDIKDFIKDSKNLGHEIYDMEENLYRMQFEYNTNVITNSAYISNAENYDPEDIEDFRNVLNQKRQELNALLNESSKRRKEINNELKSLLNKCDDLKNKLAQFEKDTLDSKKFYFRYLSYL